MAIFGRSISVAPKSWIDVPQAFVLARIGRPTIAGRLVRAGGTLRAGTGTRTASFGVYGVDAAGRPGIRLGATSAVTVAGRANYSALVNEARAGSGRVAASSGKGFAFVTPATELAVGVLTHGSAGVDVGEHGGNRKYKTTIWRRGTNTNTPPDPAGATATMRRDEMTAVWVEVLPNHAPTIGLVGPANGATQYTLTPTFAITFTDPDRTDGYEDYPVEVRVSIYESDDAGVPGALVGTVVARPYATPPAGSGALGFNVVWNGAPLAWGQTYGVVVTAIDEAGAQSNEVGAIRSGASIAQLTHLLKTSNTAYGNAMSPSGRQATLTPPFGVYYRHPQGLSANVRRARLMRRNGSAYAQVGSTYEVAAVIAPDAPWSFTHTASGFPALEWATDYRVEYQFVDTDGATSAWEAAAQPFNTNYPPTTPAALSPSGQSFSAPPALEFTTTDPDGDAVTGVVEISGPYDVNGTLDVDAGGWSAAEVQTGITATFARATANPRTGAGHGRLAITANTGASGAHARTGRPAYLPVVEGEEYTFSAWFATTNANVRGGIHVRWLTDAGTFISQSDSADYAPTVNTYQQRTLTAVAPSNAARAVVYVAAVNRTASAGAATVDFDDVVANAGVHARGVATHLGSGRHRYNVPSERLGSSGVYSFRAYGTDNVTNGAWSGLSTFQFTAGPQVAITAPASGAVLATNRPSVAWQINAGDQNRWRLLVFLRNTATVAYDSAWVVGPATRAAVVPSGFLHDDVDYDLQVQAESAAGIVGGSALLPFRVDYPTPATPINLDAVPEYLILDEEATVLRLQWTPVDTPPANLVAIEVWRQPADGSTALVRVAEYRGFDPGYYVEVTPPSGKDYRYGVRQVVRQGTDIRYSDSAWITARIDMNAAVLCEIAYPETERVPFRFWTNRGVTRRKSQGWDTPAGSSSYEEWHGNLRAADITVTAQFADAITYGGEEDITADELLYRLERLFDRHQPMLWRDPRGRFIPCLFNGDLQINDVLAGTAKYEVTFSLRQIRYEWPAGAIQ